MVADIFTKPLSMTVFLRLRAYLLTATGKPLPKDYKEARQRSQHAWMVDMINAYLQASVNQYILAQEPTL